MNRIEIGKIGEDIAHKYLLNNGYLVLSRNHREKFYEIDIISRHPQGSLVFCEVKTSNQNSGFIGGFMPEDHLGQTKHRKMIHAADIFLARHPDLVWENAGWQLDLIAIVLDKGKPSTLRHYKNI